MKLLLASVLLGTVALAQSNIPDLAKLKLAAEAGNAAAQHEYASRIALSNAKESFEFNLKSANQGFGPAEDVVGQHYLSMAPYDAKDGGKLERLGVRYTSRAAFKVIPNAQANLSECYERGTALPKNPALSYAWMALALRTAGGPGSMSALVYKMRLDQLVARIPSSAIIEGQKLAESIRAGSPEMNPVEADLIVAQMRITGFFFGDGRKAVMVNQVRFSKGETKALPIDGDAVALLCTAIEGKSAKFKMSAYEFTLLSK